MRCHHFHSIIRGSSPLRIFNSQTHKQIIVANILFSSKFCIGKGSITSQNLRSHLTEHDPTVGSQSNGMKIKTQPHQSSPPSLLMGQKPSLPFLQYSSTPQRQKYIFIYVSMKLLNIIVSTQLKLSCDKMLEWCVFCADCGLCGHSTATSTDAPLNTVSV